MGHADDRREFPVVEDPIHYEENNKRLVILYLLVHLYIISNSAELGLFGFIIELIFLFLLFLFLVMNSIQILHPYYLLSTN